MPQTRYIFAIFVLSALACLPLLIKLPGNGELSAAFNNSAHVGLFIVLTCITAALLKLPLAAISWRFTQADWLIAFALLALGGIIEVVQWFIGRNPSVLDITLDASGILAGLWLWKFIQTQRSAKPQQSTLVLAVVAASVALIEPMLVIKDRVEQEARLPLICDFDSHCPQAHAVETGRINIATEHLWQGNQSLVGQLDFGDLNGDNRGHYPGFGLGGITSDWSGYSELCLDIYWPELTPNRVAFHIHDSQFLQTHNKFDQAYGISPGISTVCVPLASVGKIVDLTGEKELIIYMRRPKNSGQLYFDNVHLR